VQILRVLFCISISCISHKQLSASINDYFYYDIVPGASNLGNSGIIEMPNARMMKPASLRFTFSSSYPNEYTSLTATPFNWFEATYRYAEIKNQRYGPSRYSGNQSLKDKGFDIKLLLSKENYYFPSLALGFRDLAGTGLFSSEYFVASKRYNNFDFTLGLGWGLLGSDGGVRNPLSLFKDSYKERGKTIGGGGKFSYSTWFTGETSLFGGIEYDLHRLGLKFKLEYDTSNPDLNNKVPIVKSRFNIGLNYYFSDNLNFSTSFERGDQFRVAFSLKGNFLEDSIKKPSPKNVVRLNDEQKKRILKDNSIFYRSINKSLRDESIYIQAASLYEEKLDIAIASKKYYSFTRSSGRAARVASALLPDEVEQINIHTMNGDLEMFTLSIGRDNLDKALNQEITYPELLKSVEINSSSQNPLFRKAIFQPDVNFPEFEWSMSPGIKHQIGGPEGFYLGQIMWKVDSSLKFKRNLSLYSSLGFNIYDTFNDFNNPSYSSIPHVRSDIQDYLKEGKNNIQRLQLQYFDSIYKDVFIRADFGYLEEMFAGVGGEVLYRPVDKKYAFGLSVHKVRQRGYKQRFSLRDYTNTTGHFSIYLDLPNEINSQIMIGEYLAGDKGLTLDLSRRFKSGFTLGIFATKTNLSAEEFGEGSFDKGFYISVPVKLFYSDFTSGNISFGLHPLTKDGGALLNQHLSLFGILGDTNKYSIERDFDYFLE